MNYHLTLKGHVVKFDLGKSQTQGHGLIGKDHAPYQSIRIVVLNTSKVFSPLYLVSIKSYCRKLPVIFNDLKWPWGNEEGSLVAIFLFKVSIPHVLRWLRVFRMVFVQKRRFQFSPVDL